MTDELQLRQKIKESGYKMQFIAEKCGITYMAFLNKLTNKSEWRSPEIAAIKELLGLSVEEMYAIFFANEVDK